jgi:UDP-N-acetylglucosamine 4,6-dehydratase
MTRFWITLDQAVDRVLDTLGFMKGGEIVVPKLPSMNIMDLVQAVAPGCKVRIVGIRPGEKLHELLFIRDEARSTLEFDGYYLIGTPFSHWLQNGEGLAGTPVPEDFEYSSETNTWKLGVEELRRNLGDA